MGTKGPKDGNLGFVPTRDARRDLITRCNGGVAGAFVAETASQWQAVIWGLTNR